MSAKLSRTAFSDHINTTLRSPEEEYASVPRIFCEAQSLSTAAMLISVQVEFLARLMAPLSGHRTQSNRVFSV
jgi:hypothetical protein